jgi:ParB family chromosome partitioning protein
MVITDNETRLVEWHQIKAEIAECKDISVMSKMNYSLEAIQKWAKQSKQSLEAQNEIAEYRLRLNRKQGEWIEKNIPEEGAKGLIQEHLQATENSHLTLAETGIDRNDSPKFRILARIPEAKFEAYISDTKEAGEINMNEACHLFNNTIATKWTGDQESYTPAIYIEAARAVMGSIDLDPASNEIAQRVVKAKTFFSKEEDGLIHDWNGNIFLNPPYSHPEIAHFIEKLLKELKDGQQAILLTNNNTDTNFFHNAARRAGALCFTKGRISFYKSDMDKTSPTNGQVFYYFGKNIDSFTKYFSNFGIVMKAF